IYWLDIWDGLLAISDEAGRLRVLNPENELLWARKSRGDEGWMVRCDRQAVYHGHRDGVTAYGMLDGRRLWHKKTEGDVLFGWQTADHVYAGTDEDRVQCFAKDRGGKGPVYECDAGVFSCATTEDGRYVFAGDTCSSVYCFEAGGRRLWKL